MPADAAAADDLVPLPDQPEGVAWPTRSWEEAPAPHDDPVVSWVDRAFDDAEPFASTLAVVVVRGGRVVAERYAEGVDAETTLISWSMAKSVLHAAVGILVGTGDLDLHEPAPVAAWSGAGDPRSGITLDHLLTMRDGLDFAEDYVDEQVSDVIEMLFGSGKADVAAYAAGRPLAHPPGSRFNYSSGTSNIVARIFGDAVGGGPAGTGAWLHRELFDRIGMGSATARFDDAGTFVASSFLYATARDFARFGLLALRGGVWDGDRILPEGWVDHGRRARSLDPDDERWHGAHWWALRDALGTFWASGYEGQRIWIVPALDLLAVRLATMPEENKRHLNPFMETLADAVT